MKPTVKVASALTPDGGEITLYHHDQDYSIRVNGHELMHSHQHESELELARLGCSHLTTRKAPSILVGGLGMGYTLREAINLLGPNAKITVCELLEAVVDWNREFLGELNGRPLNDRRVSLEQCDVVELIKRSRHSFDAILLDIDNGPEAFTDSANGRLYSRDGIKACRLALRRQGCLAIWSAEPSKPFEKLMMKCGFEVRRYRVPSHKGGKALSRFVWLASEDGDSLPPGGGKPQ
jgi:spermidine synthase